MSAGDRAGESELFPPKRHSESWREPGGTAHGVGVCFNTRKEKTLLLTECVYNMPYRFPNTAFPNKAFFPLENLSRKHEPHCKAASTAGGKEKVVPSRMIAVLHE